MICDETPELLRALAYARIEDEGDDWVVVQIDRSTWDQIQVLAAAPKPPTAKVRDPRCQTCGQRESKHAPTEGRWDGMDVKVCSGFTPEPVSGA